MTPLLLALSLAAEPAAEASALARGRELTAAFYRAETDALWKVFSPDLRQALGTAADLAGFRSALAEQLGTETAVLSEGVERRDTWSVYTRRALFEKATAIVQWTFDADGSIEGFFVKPADQAAPSEFLDYQTRTPLQLPFHGEWFVFWGGRTLTQNQHAVAPDQRFAYDFLMVKKGASKKGRGSRNQDYLCFGQPILAPAAGSVVEAVDGIEDNRPGEMNGKQPLGNHLILDHGNGEFSFLAHLKKGSLVFKSGARVGAGALVGRAGNSGHSSEPHLHYHLQTTPVFAKGQGLPAAFLGYLADGQPVPRGEPVAGQRVARAPTTASSR